MRIGRSLVFALALVIGRSGLVAAQEARKTGITMGFPQSIGVIWETSKIAVRQHARHRLFDRLR